METIGRHEGEEHGAGVCSLHVFFDVDYTLIMGDGTLRPHAREAFEQIVAMGHRIYVWSGVGIRRWEMRRYGLHELVTGYFVKPLTDYRRRLPEFQVHVVPDFVIDDHASVVEAFGGYHIPDVAPADDRALSLVVEAIRARAAAGEGPGGDSDAR